MKKATLALLMCAGLVGTVGPAEAQRTSDPNLRNFYMARQQWQIIDDSPVVTGSPGMPGGAAAAGAGALPAGPMPLPKAGWQPYSSSIPSVRTALPQVNTGVPKALPPAQNKSGQMAKAGSLKLPKQATPAPSGPVSVKSYQAYKGYGGSLTPSTGSAYGGGGLQTQTQVQGSVLHWARGKRR
ncbi:MAG TPA: hypothetical protein V6D08_12435 [Candidatus Obscuribacterales bacterium]